MATEAEVYMFLKLINDRTEEVDIAALIKDLQYEKALQVFESTKSSLKEFNETEYRRRFAVMAESVTFESALKQWAGELRANEQIAVEFNRLLQL